MTQRGPVRVADRHAFDVLIDARSPAEFALDHIPGAINCPVLDDDERRIVGTLYKQQGAFEARRVGGAMVAANLARHLNERFADKPHGWKPLVYCWRGGLRSGSMTTVSSTAARITPTCRPMPPRMTITTISMLLLKSKPPGLM